MISLLWVYLSGRFSVISDSLLALARGQKAKEEFQRLKRNNMSQPEESSPSWHMSACLLVLVYINRKCCGGDGGLGVQDLGGV